MTSYRALRNLIAAAALWAASSLPALAQTSPNWTYGYVPTQAQWNAQWASKQDYLGAPPLLTTGGTMTGPMVTTAATTASTGFNLTPGVTPTTPNNGDLWVTATGIFSQVNGVTYNLISPASTCPTCALTNAANVFTLAQTINLNATALPAGDTGTVLQLGNANATVARLEVTAIAAAATVTGRRGDNTLASPSALSPGDLIATFNAHGYDGTSWSGVVAGAFRVYADGPWSNTSHPTEGCISTTPLSSTTIADAFCVHQDGGATIGTATGGNKGIGTLNAAGLIYNNGTIPTGSGGGYVLATGPTIASPTVTGAFTATGLVTYADMATAAIASTANYLSGAANTLVPASVIYTTETTTTFGATTTFDFSTFINTAETLTGNVTTQTLSNVKAGQGGQIRFIQDATGSRTTVWNTIFKFAGGTTPTLSTAANAIDVLFYSCVSTSLCYASLVQNMK